MATQSRSIPAETIAFPPLSLPALFVGSGVYARPSFGTNHPLSFTRQGAVVEMCRLLGWLPEAEHRTSLPAAEDVLLRVHDAEYVAELRAASDRGSVTSAQRERYRFGTMENPIFSGVFERAATTVGGSILAAQLALDGNIAFHPAGGTHHGRPDRASGFCYFNDPVFALLTFLDAGLERVLYLDVDAHHGDGVFDHFAGDPRVSCMSIHEIDRWPNTGAIDEQGAGQVNIPVPQNIVDSEYALLFDEVIEPLVRGLEPQAVVICCGADALAGDPLSRMQLSNRALWLAVHRIAALVPPCVVLGGGGYNPWTTVRCWAGLWGVLSDKEFPQALPEPAQSLLGRFDSDLVDEDEIEPFWLTSLCDPPQEIGPRDAIRELASHLRKAHGLA